VPKNGSVINVIMNNYNIALVAIGTVPDAKDKNGNNGLRLSKLK
jgi:hypothetical protein